MASERPPSYGPRIVILAVLLAGILGLALNVDALLGPPPEPVEEEEEVKAPEETGLKVGTDFEMEQHIATVVLNKATEAMLKQASEGLAALPEEWSPEDLQVDTGYVEDEDEAEYYDELDQLGTVLKNSTEKERAALNSLFAKPKAAKPSKPEPTPQAKARTLALRPSAALITKKSSKPRRASSGSTTPAKKASQKAQPDPVATAQPAAAEPPAEPPAEEKPAAVGVEIDPNATAKQLIAQGRKLLLSGNPAGAEKVYRKALEKGPSSARARYGLAKAMYQRNKVPQAMTELQRILSRNKNHGSALLMMGSLLQEQGRSGEARKHYQRYLDSHQNGRRADEIRSILARL